jgi:hypothetical protein
MQVDFSAGRPPRFRAEHSSRRGCPQFLALGYSLDPCGSLHRCGPTMPPPSAMDSHRTTTSMQSPGTASPTFAGAMPVDFSADRLFPITCRVLTQAWLSPVEGRSAWSPPVLMGRVWRLGTASTVAVHFIAAVRLCRPRVPWIHTEPPRRCSPRGRLGTASTVAVHFTVAVRLCRPRVQWIHTESPRRCSPRGLPRPRSPARCQWTSRRTDRLDSVLSTRQGVAVPSSGGHFYLDFA